MLEVGILFDMDLSDPTRALTPTLDGPVLAVLAAAGRPLTVGEIAAQAARGSEIGIRRSVSRLVDQGIVTATLMGRNRVHELNRDHIAAHVAAGFAGLRLELWRRLREELATWQVPPLLATVFGSAARGDGDEGSDIDLLLVHPPLRGERRPARPAAQDKLAMLTQVLEAFATPGVASDPGVDPEVWHHQLDELRGKVQRWTGNPLQVVDMSFFEWWQPTEGHRPLLAEVRRDGIEVARSPKLPTHFGADVRVG
jgi:hypothetical protein